MQVLCVHLVCFNSWGVSDSFGIFQQFYTSTLPQPPAEISWIGEASIHAGYFHQTFTLGVFLQLLGLFMTSLCNRFTFTSGLAVMSSYFVRNCAFAVGVGAAGSAVGGLIYPVVVDRLLYVEGVGYGWAIFTVPCVFLFKPRLALRKTGPLVDWSALKEKPFVFFTLSWDQVGVSFTVNLIMVLNGVGVVGRILPGVVGDQFTGMLNMVIPLSFAAAVLMFCWAAVITEAGLYAFAAVYGVVAAALQSLFPAVATTMTPNMQKSGTRLGMIGSIVGIPCLVSPSVQGALIQRNGGDYLYAQVFAASSILVGAVAAVAARVARTGWKLNARA
ncbi:major facilitator superfamily domain-containing protein [Aspergillus spectabilis]